MLALMSNPAAGLDWRWAANLTLHKYLTNAKKINKTLINLLQQNKYE
jgi:hypothetical protein